ncbi:MAG TPA: DUF4145 domain-containing protein [Solirubrobacterales bacterium]
MRCPHCPDSFTPQWVDIQLGIDPDIDGHWHFQWTNCPSCKRLVAQLFNRVAAGRTIHEGSRQLAYPAIPSRFVPVEVEDSFADDFREASATLFVSPKASAALSRRLLQRLLRERGGVKPANLIAEIDEIREKNVLPVGLADELHSMRHVGNFAAHPIKDSETEAVTEVEEGEAEWLLELLEELLDTFFVAPAKRKIRRHVLNEKLKAAGKNPLDGPADEVEVGKAGD